MRICRSARFTTDPMTQSIPGKPWTARSAGGPSTRAYQTATTAAACWVSICRCSTTHATRSTRSRSPPTVSAYVDAAAAQAQLNRLQSGWRQCAGATLKVTVPNVPTITFAVNTPTDAGNGITTLELVPQGLPQLSVHATAAKANVVIDLLVTYTGKGMDDRARQATLAIVNSILGKIPG